MFNAYQQETIDLYRDDVSFAKADLVGDWSGSVYFEKSHIYFEDLNSLYQHMVNRGKSIRWCFCTTKLTIWEPDIDGLMSEKVDKSLYRGAWDYAKDACPVEIQALQDALRNFYKSINKEIAGYTADKSRIFLVPKSLSEISPVLSQPSKD